MKTYAELQSEHTTNEFGIITDPGKFEGETLATPYYYDCYLNGDGVVMEVSDEEREMFGLHPLYDRFVYVAESNDGFVSLEWYATRDEAEDAESEDLGLEEESEWSFCPVCDGFGIPMGSLGSRMYYRCESCGMDFSDG